MPNSLRSRLKNLVYKGVLSQKDLDRIVIVPVDGNGDLISRQAAIRLAEQGQVQGFEWQFKQLVDLPSVSVEKTGRWEWVQYDSNPNIGNWHCSECNRIVCGAITDANPVYTYKYCPECGAKMEVEE